MTGVTGEEVEACAAGKRMGVGAGVVREWERLRLKERCGVGAATTICWGLNSGLACAIPAGEGEGKVCREDLGRRGRGTERKRRWRRKLLLLWMMLEVG